MSESTYHVTLDGDWMGEYSSLADAQEAKKHAKGHIPPNERSIFLVFPEQWILIERGEQA